MTRYALLSVLLLVGRLAAQAPQISARAEADGLAIEVVWHTTVEVELPLAMAIPASERDKPRQRVEIAPAISRAAEGGFEHRATLRVADGGERWLVRVGDGDGKTFGEWYAIPPRTADRPSMTPSPAAPPATGPDPGRYLLVGVVGLLVLGYVVSEVRHRQKLRAVRANRPR